MNPFKKINTKKKKKREGRKATPKFTMEDDTKGHVHEIFFQYFQNVLYKASITFISRTIFIKKLCNRH